MTAPDLAELRRLSEAGTAGPWKWYAEGPMTTLQSNAEGNGYGGPGHILSPHVCAACADRGAPCLSPSSEDAALIVAAVNALPWLLNRIAELEGTLVRVENTLEGEW